ncbi:MAG TPA: hypothetical protein V6C81_10390 [Planktothrix sp.]|jgi:hypothetical protein
MAKLESDISTRPDASSDNISAATSRQIQSGFSEKSNSGSATAHENEANGDEVRLGNPFRSHEGFNPGGPNEPHPIGPEKPVHPIEPIGTPPERPIGPNEPLPVGPAKPVEPISRITGTLNDGSSSSLDVSPLSTMTAGQIANPGQDITYGSQNGSSSGSPGESAWSPGSVIPGGGGDSVGALTGSGDITGVSGLSTGDGTQLSSTQSGSGDLIGTSQNGGSDSIGSTGNGNFVADGGYTRVSDGGSDGSEFDFGV